MNVPLKEFIHRFIAKIILIRSIFWTDFLLKTTRLLIHGLGLAILDWFRVAFSCEPYCWEDNLDWINFWVISVSYPLGYNDHSALLNPWIRIRELILVHFVVLSFMHCLIGMIIIIGSTLSVNPLWVYLKTLFRVFFLNPWIKSRSRIREFILTHLTEVFFWRIN